MALPSPPATRLLRLDLALVLVLAVVVIVRLAVPRVESVPYQDLLADRSPDDLRACVDDTTLPLSLRERALHYFATKAGPEAASRLALSRLRDEGQGTAASGDGEDPARDLFLATVREHPAATLVSDFAAACESGAIREEEWFADLRPAWSATCTAFAWEQLLALHRESSAAREPWTSPQYPWLLEVLATGPYAWRVLEEANAYVAATAADDVEAIRDRRLLRAVALVEADGLPAYRDQVVRLVREVILVQNRWPTDAADASAFVAVFFSIVAHLRDDADVRAMLTPVTTDPRFATTWAGPTARFLAETPD